MNEALKAVFDTMTPEEQKQFSRDRREALRSAKDQAREAPCVIYTYSTPLGGFTGVYAATERGTVFLGGGKQ